MFEFHTKRKERGRGHAGSHCVGAFRLSRSSVEAFASQNKGQKNPHPELSTLQQASSCLSTTRKSSRGRAEKSDKLSGLNTQHGGGRRVKDGASCVKLHGGDNQIITL